MDPHKRKSRRQAEAIRALRPTMAREGAKVRTARRRRRWTQAELGRRCALSQQTVSQLERGEGATLSVATWQRLASQLGLWFRLELGRDMLEEPLDAGHLGLQELVLRLGRRAGYSRTFELPTKPSTPALSVDVGLVDHSKGRLLLVECVNVFADIGAATRSSDRKLQEAASLAIALGQGKAYTVHACWVLRDTARNRQLIARYPEVFASRFPGPSARWVDALMDGRDPPMERGLVWSDVRATRLFAWRRTSYPARREQR